MEKSASHVDMLVEVAVRQRVEEREQRPEAGGADGTLHLQPHAVEAGGLDVERVRHDTLVQHGSDELGHKVEDTLPRLLCGDPRGGGVARELHEGHDAIVLVQEGGRGRGDVVVRDRLAQA
eukprot:1180449-Prorocentrum_minimum.AAC.4